MEQSNLKVTCLFYVVMHLAITFVCFKFTQNRGDSIYEYLFIGSFHVKSTNGKKVDVSEFL